MDQLLVAKGLVSTRTRAEELVKRGAVEVDGKVILKSGKKFSPEAEIHLHEQELPWVSRGALKLLGALDHWQIDLKQKVVLDVGASTGGFTQVLLERGAKLVHAVDTGKDQLAEVLRTDARVNNLESTNLRDLTESSLVPAPEMAVMDVSFTSQTLLYPALYLLLPTGASILSLVKPQFEAGREHLGRGGIVRDPKVHQKVLDQVSRCALETGFELVEIIDSPIEGGDGNKEFLIHLRKKA